MFYKARRLGVVFAALALTVMAVSPAFANDLHQTGTINADTFENQNCEGSVDPGQTLWHFVHTDAKSESLPSTLTATFVDGDNVEHVVMASGYVNGNSIVMYEITVDSSWQLLGGDKTSDSITNDGNLNLSSVCIGEPPPEIPEAPAAVLLVMLSMLSVGGYLLWNRRRATQSV